MSRTTVCFHSGVDAAGVLIRCPFAELVHPSLSSTGYQWLVAGHFYRESFWDQMLSHPAMPGRLYSLLKVVNRQWPINMGENWGEKRSPLASRWELSCGTVKLQNCLWDQAETSPPLNPCLCWLLLMSSAASLTPLQIWLETTHFITHLHMNLSQELFVMDLN